MHANPNADPQSTHAFELKGRMLTLSVLRLNTADLDSLNRQLDAKIAEAPGFFSNAPVLVDVEPLTGQALDFQALVPSLRRHGFIPVGVRGSDPEQTAAAAAAGLGLISGGSEGPKRAEPTRERRGERAPAPAAGMIVRQPVRSGQQIYARGGDLVVLAPVSAGAEVLADGHIHIYGPLRGRALAGVQGNAEARIFCHSLEAELISIAGSYRVSENIQPSERGKPVQIHLQGDALCIEPL